MANNVLADIFPKMDEFIFSDATTRIIYLFLKNIWKEFFVNHPTDIAFYYNPGTSSRDSIKMYVNTTNGIAMKFKIIQFSGSIVATVPSLEEFYIYKPAFEKTQIKPDGYHRYLKYDKSTQEFSVEYSTDLRYTRNRGYIIEGMADHRFSMDPNVWERSDLYFNVIFKNIWIDGRSEWSSRTSRRIPFYHILTILPQIKSLIIDDTGLMPHLNSRLADSMHYNAL